MRASTQPPRKGFVRHDLRNRVAVITGASSGIGRAAALAFAREGVRVVLGARRADRLQETVEALRSAGGAARSLQIDVTRLEEVTRLVREAVAAFGRLDLLVNNAGLGYFGRLESMPMDRKSTRLNSS